MNTSLMATLEFVFLVAFAYGATAAAPLLGLNIAPTDIVATIALYTAIQARRVRP